ncbi:hypothetical protein [Oerskovia turbata]|uniref:hypothetical protein n=1 Tax=Oerskovia turbata TaxID=1713 RepID=UPI0004BE4D54
MDGPERGQLADGVEDADELAELDDPPLDPLLVDPDAELLDGSADFAGAADVVEPVLDDFEERESVR